MFKSIPFFGQQAVGGEVRDHATHPINVREQLLEEQTAEQGLGGHINGAPEYPNGLIELSAAGMSQGEVQELTKQAVEQRSYTSEMRQARWGVIVIFFFFFVTFDTNYLTIYNISSSKGDYFVKTRRGNLFTAPLPDVIFIKY